MPDCADVGIMLVTSGADVCAVDSNGATPLHLLAAEMQKVGAEDERRLAAMLATFARATPGALDVLDVRRRTPRACIPGGSVPRLDNLLWRLSTPRIALPPLTSPWHFYDHWLHRRYPQAALLEGTASAGYDDASGSLPANKSARLRTVGHPRRRQTVDSR